MNAHHPLQSHRWTARAFEARAAATRAFHLKADPHGALQFGLIAEEVAKVYPELVIRNGSGRIDGVRYDELAPMLLNAVRQEATEIRALKQQPVTQSSQLRSPEEITKLNPAALPLDAGALSYWHCSIEFTPQMPA